jgi:acetylornithine/succinyldiaminopimelate/putrescine aminotransferase/predicted amino acid dehydrogenase
MKPYPAHANRELGTLLTQLGITETFIRASGLSCWPEDGTEFLDMTASYGALAFGHNPPFLVDAVRAFLDAGSPNLCKGNPSLAEGRAAERLCSVFGAQRAIFTSGGAETANLAIKSARLITGRQKVLSFWSSFHGTTGDALRATGNHRFREVFATSYDGASVLCDYNDLAGVERSFAEHPGEFACVIVEPVLGEGGVVPGSRDFLLGLRELCRREGALLVVDEIQTGLGRCGHLSRALSHGVEPELLLLSKGLTGGFVPAGCCLFRGVWDPSLGLHHSSTFGGNGLAMTLIPRVLDRLDEALLAEVRTRGAALLNGLRGLAERFPELVAEARGDGLLLGLEFQSEPPTGSRFLRELIRMFGLLPAAVAYVRHEHHVCLATTLNTHNTLRVTPPLLVTQEQATRTIDALESFLEAFRRGRVPEVLRYLVDKTLRVDLAWVRRHQLDEQTRQLELPEVIPQVVQDGPAPVAFLVHPNEADYLLNFDPTFGSLTPAQREHVALNLQGVIGPVPWHDFRVGQLQVHVLASPLLPQEMARVGRGIWLDEIQTMILQARERGARLVGLGGLLSVVARDGLALPELGVAVTTGNSLTAFAAYESVLEAIRTRHGGERPAIGVLGGYGNIGQAVVELLLRDGFEVTIFGNPANPLRAQLLARARSELLARPGVTGRLSLADSLTELGTKPSVILAATSNPGFKLDISALPPGTVVLDLAMPPALTSAEALERPEISCFQVGQVSTPVVIPQLHLLELSASIYGCLAETIVLGLDGRHEDYSRGSLETAKVLAIGKRAGELGFSSASVPLQG